MNNSVSLTGTPTGATPATGTGSSSVDLFSALSSTDVYKKV